MDLEKFVKRIGPFVPLLIAAGYFIFLIATWQTFVNESAMRKAKIDEILDQLKPKESHGPNEPTA